MKKEQKRIKKQKQRKRKGTEKELKNQRAAYSANPIKRKKKQERATNHYHENREVLSKQYRDKAREARNCSGTNDAKYREGIKLGPLFICACCHGALFKENVKIFTDKMQKKNLAKYFKRFLHF